MIAIIPHFSSFGEPRVRALLESATASGATVVSPTRGYREVISAVSCAELVLTSSLHGKVVADAIGVPAALIDFEIGREPRDKYDDYLSVWGRRARFFSTKRGLMDVVPDARSYALDEVDAIALTIDPIVSELRYVLRSHIQGLT